MKPKTKQELEQLLEAEFAEAEALAEQEAAFSPYRTDEELSTRLDIPRDVKGLVELLEEKKRDIRNLEITMVEKYPKSFRMLSVTSGFLAGGVSGLAMIAHGQYVRNVTEFTIGMFLLYIGGIVGMISGLPMDNYLRKNSAGARKFELDKQRRIQELQEKLEPIDQKLSRYETKYFAGDILFLDDKELGYCLGNVVVEREERVLRQKYIMGTPDDGYRSYTRTKAIKDEEIICVLNPKEELSVDDLLSLDSQTPVLWQDGDYGFFQRKDQEDKLVISTQKGLYLPSRQDSYTFQQIESGEITPRLLVPEVKSRI